MRRLLKPIFWIAMETIKKIPILTLSLLMLSCALSLATEAPKITNITPSKASIADTVTITGHSFGPYPGDPNYNSSADITHDGMVNAEDHTALFSHFGLRSTDPAYNPAADINRDGRIDLTDFAALRAAYGSKRGNSYVEFYNDVWAKIISWSDTEIVCGVPDGATSNNLFVVTNDGRSNGFYLTIVPLAEEFGKSYLHLYRRMDAYVQDGNRLIESYTEPYSLTTEDLAYTYDNALAILALLARKEPEDIVRARVLCESLIWVQEHDPTFTDGRVRDGYYASDIRNPAGTSASVKSPGSGCGNMAWTIIAWMQYYRYSNDADSSFLDKLLTCAKRLGEFIELEYRDPVTPGYTGGFDGWEPDQTKQSWRSTEHNLDVYAAFIHLYSATEEPENEIWLERANYAKEFIVSRMWNPAEGMFWVGTGPDGRTVNTAYDQQVENVNSWAILALDDVDFYGNALAWVENNCAVSCDGSQASQQHFLFDGFDFNTDKDGVWFEGTAHMALAYKITGDTAKADHYINQLRKAQSEALNNNLHGIASACHDNVSTGFGWDYFASVHIGATAWYLTSELGYNMFWGPDDLIPPDVSIISPSDGATLAGETEITVEASDNREVEKVEFYIGGALRATDNLSPYAYAWETTGSPNGNCSIKAVAYDVSGNAAGTEINTILENLPPNSPTLNPVVTPTNMAVQVLSGIKGSNTSIYINGYESIPLSGETSWNYEITLNEGDNNLFVTARDQYGLESAATTACILLDTTPPAIPAVTDDGVVTIYPDRLHATWSANDAETGIGEYQYAIGTSPGSADVIDWTPCDLQTEVDQTGLNLTSGQTYYISVKAKNTAGSWSEVGSSDGITVNQAAPVINNVIPVDGGLFEVGDIVSFDIEAADLEGDGISYKIVIDGGVVRDWSEAATFDWYTFSQETGIRNATIYVKDTWNNESSQDVEIYLARGTIDLPQVTQ